MKIKYVAYLYGWNLCEEADKKFVYFVFYEIYYFETWVSNQVIDV